MLYSSNVWCKEILDHYFPIILESCFPEIKVFIKG